MKLFIIGIIYGPMLLAALGGFIRYRAIMGFQSTLNEGLDFKTFRQRIKASEFGGRYKLGMALIIGAPLVALAGFALVVFVNSMSYYATTA
ncbi:hypothetical protein WJ97_12140 [Burkholderia ubonensis]|uniref:hypothetical protein n=1 Tax=Burkholderia ubonensis TaxID=101571 RepID=UPI0007581B7D|nr:hypothetical protein [Burkholderia ubonensis]KVP96627.1 hypothetical protein WJ97_12140 [Burkholderia ubonensis]